MRLSIIVPVYNEAPFLMRCLKSLPIMEDVETIIVDDGSTDGSAEICRLFSEQHRVILRVDNRGVSAARNLALAEATGDFVTFLDADDELRRGAINDMLKAADAAEERGDIITMFNHMRCYGNAEPVPRFINSRGYYDLKNPPQKWTTVWGKIINREFLRENGIKFRSGIQYGEDEIFLLECLRLCKRMYHVDAVAILKHYDNPNSLTKTLTKKTVNELIRAEMTLLERDNPPAFDAHLRQIIADHWNSPTFVGIYGKIKS